MKAINTYISEKLVIGNNLDGYAYPETKEELIKAIQNKISKEGLGTENKPLDLNDIDTSEITDMSDLFNGYNGNLMKLSNNGYFDISYWDVSNVENMYDMFYRSSFNGNISKWDVSKVKNMRGMFSHSKFNNNISDWNVSNVEDMSLMFADSDFNSDINNWDVRNVKNMEGMFTSSSFNININSWKVNADTKMLWMFDGCPIQNKPPKWYKKY